ncbi:uncharacterized protein [Drosophila suzukii]|uniref:Uncharacterized protein n=1 Tax=Drosophila suzukii TaxID=28584 RepID=A0ABM4TXH0_DROSZ
MAELPVKVGPLPNNTGTYVELRNRIALMSAEWTIISYFDLRLFAQEITAFKKNIEELSTWCLRGGSCPKIIHVLEQEASELYDGQQLFNHHRQRRGALNLVGNLANGLFGVLDSQYAQNMEEVIRKIQAKELHNTHLLKNQTSILDSTINVMRTMMVSEVQELDNTLIFHTKIPLVDEEEYDVYQLTPIPVATQDHIIATETEAKYLSISDHRDRHFALSVEELNQCTKMSKGPMLCNIKQTTLGPAHEQFQCALAAVQSEQNSSCKPERINTTSIWYPLDAPNSWIFATTQEVTLTYVCGDEKYKCIIMES